MMGERTPDPGEVRLAETLREVCVRAARTAYKDASMRGLCSEGAWEAALGAIQTLDVTEFLRERPRPSGGS